MRRPATTDSPPARPIPEGILGTERQHTRVAVWFFVFMILLLFAVASIPGAWPEALAQPIVELLWPFFILFGGMLLYEWMLRLRIGCLLRSVLPENHNSALLAASGSTRESIH